MDSQSAEELPDILATPITQQRQQPVETRRTRQRRVRLHFLSAFAALTSRSKIMFLVRFVAYLALLSIGITSVTISEISGEQCNEPLLVYIIIYVLRAVVALPVFVYLKLFPPGGLPAQAPAAPVQQNTTLDNTSRPVVSDANDGDDVANSLQSGSTENLNEPAAQIHPVQEDPEPPIQPTIRTDPTKIERLSSMLDLFGTLWFVFGNRWLFSATACSETSPWLFFTTLSYIIVGYSVILVPVILILCIIFCLPLVIILIRVIQNVTGVNLAPALSHNGMQAAKESVIREIETSTYSKDSSELNDEDAHCVICLGDYQEGEKMKIMPTCKHHFHAECLDQWLHVNKTCPLCVRDVEEEIKKEKTVVSKPKFWAKFKSNGSSSSSSEN